MAEVRLGLIPRAFTPNSWSMEKESHETTETPSLWQCA